MENLQLLTCVFDINEVADIHNAELEEISNFNNSLIIF